MSETEVKSNKSRKDDDPVVKSFDVSLSHTLTENLYSIQFPLRSPKNPYDFNTLKEMRYKKDHKVLEMDFELNAKSEHYDSESQFDRKFYTLSSNQVPLKTNYCIGVLRGDQFHITPLKNIMQMKHKLDYLSDDKYSKEKIIKKDKKATQAKLVTPTMQSREEEEALKRSFEYVKQLEQSEPWIKMKVFQRGTVDSSSVGDQLFQKNFDSVKFDLGPSKYLDLIVPYENSDQGMQKSVSLHDFKSFDATTQIIVSLMAAKILSYGRIKELCKKAKSDEQILTHLEKMGVVIDGNWICKSDSLRIPPKMMICRDYMLYLLYTHGYVNRRDFMEQTNLSNEECFDLLSEVCRLDTLSKTWILKLHKDEAFIKKYPEIIFKQKKEWEIRTALIMNSLKNLRKSSTLVKPRETVTMTSTLSEPSDLNEKLQVYFIQMFKQYGVCNLALLKESFVKDFIHLKKLVTEEMYQNALHLVARPFGDSSFVRKSLGDPQIDKFRDVVIDLFIEKGTLKKEEIRDRVNEKLKTPITPAVYATITKELAIQSGTSWKPKTGNIVK